MLLKLIKRELISFLLWYKGFMYRSPHPYQIKRFPEKLTTTLNFESNIATKKNVIEIRIQ